jgi:hypothetical protein
MQTPAPIMSPVDFAAFVGYSKSHINALINSGKLDGVFGSKGDKRGHPRISVIDALESLNLPREKAERLLAHYAPAQPAPVCVSYFISVPSTLQPQGAVVSLASTETPQPERKGER